MSESFFRFTAPAGSDPRIDAPAFHRNKTPIWQVLSQFLVGKDGDVLEIASGTGQHVVTFARETPGLKWWPSDPDAMHRRSIAAWTTHAALTNVCAPRALDLAAPDWGLDPTDKFPEEFIALFCANVLHISPWAVTEGLFAGAADRLAAGGRLFIYGPFMRDGKHTAESNAAFDRDLRARNPEWGVRDIDDLAGLAHAGGLRLAEIVDMPANNLILVFEQARSSSSRGA